MVSYEDFRKLDIKTAKIVDAKEHPNADRLLILTIDNSAELKQIVAGIKLSYSPDQLKGKTVILIDNLDPAKIRGEESLGMLLAVSDENGPVLVVPDKDVPPGRTVK